MIKECIKPTVDATTTEGYVCVCKRCRNYNYYEKAQKFEINTMVENENRNRLIHNGFFIRQKEYYIKLLFEDIMWVEADRSYCYIHVTDHSSMLVTFPLSDVRKLLSPDVFVQIHRSYLVNINHISKFIGNMVYIETKSLPISQKYKSDVMSRLLILERKK